MATVTRRPKDENARLGKSIYERDIRPLVEADHHGECVAIDVDSGCWAMAGNELGAVDRLRADRPDALNVWLLRVGHQALYSFGGEALSAAE